MNSPADALDAITGDLAGVLAGADSRGMSDEDVLSVTVAVERLGRRLDAARVQLAGEVAERSRKTLGADGLSAKKGCRSAQELLERLTLVSGVSVNRRMRLGAGTRTRLSLGSIYPAKFPVVADALAAGTLGLDAAGVIVKALAQVADRVPADQVHVAETELVAVACGVNTNPDDDSAHLPVTADEVRLQAAVWQAYLDPDGVEPAEERALAKRGIRLGALRDGLVPVSGNLMPEIAGKLTRLFDAYLSPRTAPAFLSAEEQAAAEQAAEAIGSTGGGEQPVLRDPRSRDQQRHDVLAGILDIAARSAEAPLIGGAPPTVLVSVRKEDLESGTGAGWIDGVDAPVSMRSVKQFACTGGMQRIVFDDTGKIIQLGSPERCFTGAQRRAIMERDGGCIIPGCTIPAAWTEIHHVDPAANQGETHTSNGVCLCWFHHHMLETSGWQIRMINGIPQIKAPPWLRPDDNWHPAGKSRTRLNQALKRR